MPSGGSHPRYSRELRGLLESHLAAGVKGRDIVRALRVSESFVSQIRARFEIFGTTSPTHPGVQGHPRKIHHEAEEGIKDFLDEYPTTRLDEIEDFLADEYDIVVGLSTVSQCLKRICVTYKTARKVHTKQDEAIQAAYFAKVLRSYTTNQIVVVDESIANE